MLVLLTVKLFEPMPVGWHIKVKGDSNTNDVYTTNLKRAPLSSTIYHTIVGARFFQLHLTFTVSLTNSDTVTVTFTPF